MMKTESGYLDRKIEADEILSFDSNILMCAMLDLKGNITSSAESPKWKFRMLPANNLGERALVSHLMFEGLPQELGKMRFKIAFTDTYKIASMRLGKCVAVFVLSQEINAEPICLDILRNYGLSGAVLENETLEVSGKRVLECQNCGRNVDSDSDPAAESYLIDVQERVEGDLQVIKHNIPITICSKCKRKFGKPRYLFRGKVEFEEWNVQ
ncbi:MAG TPA: hypothetical protein VFF30_13960 [Nitrososphaerales archaeon]|nr:hypothetical protein [Nitrososphaerales archaeon]